MGLLNLFYTKTIEDEVFGDLEYQIQFFSKHFWQGSVEFAPVGHKIDIYLEAGQKGVHSSQRHFFLELPTKYTELQEEIIDSAKWTIWDYCAEYREIIETNDIDEEFRLERLLIPDLSNSASEWELSYVFANSEFCTVYLEGWRVSWASYDD